MLESLFFMSFKLFRPFDLSVLWSEVKSINIFKIS